MTEPRSEESRGTLLALKEAGKVRAVGLSNHGLDALGRAERVGHVESLQPPLSLINRVAAGEKIPWCHEHNTGVIVYSPLHTGLLGGGFSVERAASLRRDDWQSEDRDFTGDRLRRNLALVETVREVASARGASVAEVAVAWTIHWPGVTAAIVGARSPEQVDGWVGAARLSLSPEELATLTSATFEAGEGPNAPGSVSVSSVGTAN